MPITFQKIPGYDQVKDSNDNQTLDLLEKPRRGRPSTGKAKSQAQIQREYRQRQAAIKNHDRVFIIELSDRELSSIVYGLDREFKCLTALGHPKAPCVDQLRELLRAHFQGKKKGRKITSPEVAEYSAQLASGEVLPHPLP